MTELNDEQILEYRKLLQDLEVKSLESYDKSVMTLSGGGLAISFAFLNDIIGDGAIICNSLLLISWTAWSLSILSVIFSFLCSHYALNKAIVSIDKNENTKRLGGGFDLLTRILNFSSGILFFIGTICMVIFATKNIG